MAGGRTASWAHAPKLAVGRRGQDSPNSPTHRRTEGRGGGSRVKMKSMRVTHLPHGCGKTQARVRAAVLCPTQQATELLFGVRRIHVREIHRLPNIPRLSCPRAMLTIRMKCRRLLTPMCITMNTRKLLPSEAAKLRDHLARLTREDRSLRFMGAQNDAAVTEHCERLNWFRTVVVGFFDAGVLRGVAELQVADNHFPILCEVAISVETAWQDQGVATELLRRVLVIARNRLARGVQINCFGDNYRIRHIAQKCGARFHCKAGESEAEIPTRAPTYSSLCEEMIDDGFGWMSLWFDQISCRPPSHDATDETSTNADGSGHISP
jgi:RimJ/RimL family protein N-acetyltransferase